ncbi:MAG: sulfotransferase family protein [Anaerolineae bacterium]|nr:sulfotransferase family protein [Anaerolineae bacterium]MCB0199360.1 sulfotransferase family protein [Anaerolineae bacterium]MCB0205949.1 sulfotransferase family protein [Anaerolineae bacterium]
MLQIIGAGFGRTGTHSLALALEKLGFGPCYTIHSVSRNPEHRSLWKDAMHGKQVDWDSLFTGFRSAVDWPTVAFIPELVGYFSSAKVVLTLRDPDAWYESASATIFTGLELTAQNPDPVRREGGGFNRRLILERTFGNRHRDKTHAIHVFQEHNENVVRMTPQDRLLQFNVTEGWQPLCQFLDKPVPDEPFPKSNMRDDFLASAPEWAKEITRSRPATS